MKVAELRKMNASDLKKELLGLLREQFNLRMQKGSKQLAQTSNLKSVRRKIARVKTILHQVTG